MQRREIIHFVENLARGGLERTVIDLIAAQREAGHACRVVCLFEPGQLAAELIDQGVRVDACHKGGGLEWRTLRRARAWLAESPDAILHTHNATAHYHAVIAGLGLPLARIVNTRHGMGAPQPRSRKEWLYRRSLALTDYVVGVCEAARARFETQGVRPRRDLLAIPNGIRLERFTPGTDATRSALAQELGWASDSLIIGTVGRLNPVKDQRTLVRAFAQVHRREPRARLLIVGDGEQRGPLQTAIRDAGLDRHARLLGDRSDIPRLLAGMHAFALPSLSEGYSIALLEACAAGVPILASAVGGNGEIVREGRNGHLLPAGVADAWADALLRVLADPAHAARLGQGGRDWVLAEGAFRTMAARYECLYAGRRLDVAAAADVVELA